ncbi:putative phage abortive infection protein [Parabacteroides distasonis]|nr:putative phage abortive infection protein [Parabacteroides distasonis]
MIQAVCKINHDHSLGLGGQDIASIAYVVFYYGLSESWKNFIEDKIQCYDCRQVIIDGLLELSQQNPELNLCRTNQTILSAYFRNMYNAIKLIDKEACFSDEEKKELIKIYRAQLSNPELYVLFFNIISPFGKKWVEQKYVVKYALLKNIPYNYLDGYNPKHFFDIVYEYEELTCSETFQYMESPAIESATPLCVAEGERSKGRNKKKLCFCGFFCRISK